MKTFNKTCAQGDVLFIKINRLPKNLISVTAENNEIVVTHSETGHHHVMVLDKEDIPSVEMFSEKNNPMIAWLKVNRPVALEHRRNFDTHESILFSPGIYEVRRQREYSPEGWRRVAD